MLIALARFSSPHDVGEYTLALAVAAPAYFLANLKLRQVAITDARNEYQYSEYLSMRLLSTAIVWSAIAIPAFLIPTDPNWVLIGVSTFKAFDNLSDIYYAAPHRRGSLGAVSFSLGARGVAATAVFVTFLASSADLPVAVGSVVAVYFVGSVADLRLASRYEPVRPHFNRIRLSLLFKMTFPLGLALATSSLNSMLPRYALQSSDGTAAVGYFSTAAYLLTLGGLIINSVAQAAAPRLAITWAESGREPFLALLRRLLTVGLVLGIGMLAGCAFFGQWALELLFGDAYRTAGTTLTILALGTLATYVSVFLGTALNALRQFQYPFPVTLVCTLVTLVAAALLTPSWSLEGAAIAVCCGSMTELGLNAWATRRSIRSLA